MAMDMRTLEESGQGKKLFKLYRAFQVVGKEMKDDLLNSADAVRKDKNEYLFNMTGTSKTPGLLNQTYGLFVLSSLMDRYGVAFSDAEKNKYKGTLKGVIGYIEKHGLDASPYSTPEINNELFKGGTAFIESLTWTLSCLFFARRLHVSKKIDLSGEMDKIVALTARLLKTLLDNVIRSNGQLGYIESDAKTDYIGWGPVTGCEEAALYFTHSVCETFGDLEDTVIGNKELDIDADDEFVEKLKAVYKRDVVEQFRDLCAIVGKNVYEKYADQIGKEFFYANGERASFEQISCSMQSPVLLNHLYVVLCAIYTNYKSGVDKESDEWKKYSADIKNAVDIVYKAYRDLQNLGKEGLVNREYVTFSEKHANKKFCTYLARERINVSVLEALIIRTKCMIVTYVTQYPEKEIGELLNVILSERSDGADGSGSWLWSKLNYDLQQTERSISAIREFYDYYEKYEKDFAAKSADLEMLQKNYDEQVAALESSYKEKIKETKRSAEERIAGIAAEKQAAIEAANNSNMVESAVRAVVAESVKGELVSVLISMLNKIAEDNAENRADNAKRDLSFDEDRLRTSLIGVAKSFLLPIAQKAIEISLDTAEKSGKDWASHNLVELFSADLAKLVKVWMVGLSKENDPKDTYSESDPEVGIADFIDIFNTAQTPRE